MPPLEQHMSSLGLCGDRRTPRAQSYGTRLDLLAIDADGDLYAIELKRDPRLVRSFAALNDTVSPPSVCIAQERRPMCLSASRQQARQP